MTQTSVVEMPAASSASSAAFADPPQIGAADRLQGLAAQRIELQIDLKRAFHLGERGDKIRILCDADAIGVEASHGGSAAHARARRISSICGCRVGSAAGNLQQIRLAFALDQQVEHALDLGERR